MRRRKQAKRETMNKTIGLLGAAALLATTGALSQPAHAGIHCEGPFQVVHGNRVATPYCQDNYIAYVANRSYGIRVSPSQIRYNPNKKVEVCRIVGTDARLRSACAGYGLDGGDLRR